MWYNYNKIQKMEEICLKFWAYLEDKPGKLTDEEYEKIKDHPKIGYQILENTSSDKLSNDVLDYAKEITLHHHEKYDGTGYPDKLKNINEKYKEE